MKIQVISIRRVNGCGNLKAFVDVCLDDTLTIRGCTVMAGEKGARVFMPRRVDNHGLWSDVVTYLDDTTKCAFSSSILKAYNLGGM